MSNQRKLLYFGIIVFLIVAFSFSVGLILRGNYLFKLPYITKIIQLSNEGKKDLEFAKMSVLTGNNEEGAHHLKSADQNFNEALLTLYNFDFLYTRIIPYSPINTAEKLLLSALDGVKAANYLNHAYWTLLTEKNLTKSLISVENAMFALDRIEQNFARFNHLFIPTSILENINKIQHYFDSSSKYRSFLLKHIATLNNLFGKDDAKTYVVLLQNTAEARANGGFIGSILLFTTQGGKISSYELIDTHLIDFKSGFYLPAPEYYKYIPRIDLKEVNYIPDIRVTSEQVINLLEKADGPTVSAVFYVNDQILPFLLDITGPLKVAGFDTRISKENYFELLQYDLEWKNISTDVRVKNPKENFFNLVKAIFSQLLNIQFAEISTDDFYKIITSKQFQAYSRDEKLQEFFDDLNLSGHFPEIKAEEDFFAVVHSTFFNKSNRFMKDEISHSTFIDQENQLKNVVSIKRRHTYREELSAKIFDEVGINNEKSVFKNKFLDVIGRGANLDLLRVYVPKGSILKNSRGIAKEEIYIGEELGRTFFAFSLETATAEEREVVLEYVLPFNFTDEYALYVWKQSGNEETEFRKELSFFTEDLKDDFKRDLYYQLDSDYYVKAKINKFLWIKQLEMTAQKIKLPSKLKMKLELEFIPML